MKILVHVLMPLALTFTVASSAAAQQPAPAERAREAARQAFARADVNKDGVISAEELQRALRLRQRPAVQRRIRQLQARMRRLDTNGDRVISREEWAGRGPAFERLDANKNGVLEPAEIRRGMARAGRARVPR